MHLVLTIKIRGNTILKHHYFSLYNHNQPHTKPYAYKNYNNMLRNIAKLGKLAPVRSMNRRLVHSTAALSQYTAPLKEYNFVLNDVHNVDEHFKTLKKTGGDLADKDTVQMILEASAQFSEEVLSPLNEVGDQSGCTYIDEHNRPVTALDLAKAMELQGIVHISVSILRKPCRMNYKNTAYVVLLV